MMLEIALVVFGSSIAAFFADEWERLFRKLVAIPGVKLLVPLIFVSWLIEMYSDWGEWLLLWVQAKLYQFESHIASIIPFETSTLSLIRILYLSILAMLPAMVFWSIARYKGYDKKPLYSYKTGIILWIVAVVLIVVDISID